MGMEVCAQFQYKCIILHNYITYITSYLYYITSHLYNITLHIVHYIAFISFGSIYELDWPTIRHKTFHLVYLNMLKYFRQYLEQTLDFDESVCPVVHRNEGK